MAALLAVVACGSGTTSPPVDAKVPVDLQNFKITTAAHVKAGIIQFDLDGIGPTMHEFNVARTDLDPTKLPLSDDGTVDDQTEHSDFTHIAEREGIDMGEHSMLTVQLKPGRYVLYCNMEGHYQAGMHAEITVT